MQTLKKASHCPQMYTLHLQLLQLLSFSSAKLMKRLHTDKHKCTLSISSFCNPSSFSSAAPAMIFSFSAAALLFLVSGPISSFYALDVSSACPHLLTSSNVKNYKRASNDTLLVVVPWKVGFEQFVHFNPDSCFIDGFSVQVFLQALRHMPNSLPYQFVLHGDGKLTPHFEEMIDMVAEGDVDAVVADLTITKERMEKVGFTMPYLPSTLVMVTPFRYGSARTFWDFLKPFSIPLWLTLFGSFVATGAALYLLENKNPDFSTALKKPHVVLSPNSSGHGRSSTIDHPDPAPVHQASIAPTAEVSTSASNPSAPGALSRQMDSLASASTHAYARGIDSTYVPSSDPSSLQRPGHPIYDQASHKRRILNAYWFTSLCVFAAQQESVRTHLGRFVTVMWLFVMLIFNSSYTASLASLLSAQKRYPTIEGFQALLSDKNMTVGYQAGSFMKDYVNKIHIEPDRLKVISSEKSYVNALDQGNGKPDGVGAVLDELPYVQILLQSKCFFTRGPADDDLPSWGGFAFAFRKNSPLLEEMSKMIVAMQEDETLKRLQNGWGIGGGKGDSCSSADEDPSHLRLRSFGGLFCVLCGAYVVSVAWRLLAKAAQSDGDICMNVFACAKNGCNICQGEVLSRRLSRVRDASLENRDASLEDRDASFEHSQG